MWQGSANPIEWRIVSFYRVHLGLCGYGRALRSLYTCVWNSARNAVASVSLCNGLCPNLRFQVTTYINYCISLEFYAVSRCRRRTATSAPCQYWRPVGARQQTGSFMETPTVTGHVEKRTTIDTTPLGTDDIQQQVFE